MERRANDIGATAGNGNPSGEEHGTDVQASLDAALPAFAKTSVYGIRPLLAHGRHIADAFKSASGVRTSIKMSGEATQVSSFEASAERSAFF